MYDDPPSSPPPRRGAPPGNLNALKHGFYSRLFRKTELKNLQEGILGKGLEDEIDMLRLIIRRTVDRAGEVQTLDQSLRFLNAISLATVQLSRLLRIHKLVHNPQNEFQEAMDQALADLTEEWHLRQLVNPSSIDHPTSRFPNDT